MISNSVPPIAIAVGAAPRFATWLLRRDDVRNEPITHSTQAANAAAAVPWIASSRKTIVSHVAIEYLVRGIWIGNAAAIAVIAIQPRICTRSLAGRCASRRAQIESATKPHSATTSQRRVAPGP